MIPLGDISIMTDQRRNGADVQKQVLLHRAGRRFAPSAIVRSDTEPGQSTIVQFVGYTG